MFYTYRYKLPLGDLLLASEGDRLVGLWFEGQKYFADTIKGLETLEEFRPIFGRTVEWLDIYFSGRDPGFTPNLLIKTTEFRKAVWEILLTIPYGETMTYGEIAGRLAKEQGMTRMSPQAVGGAVGHNPISLIIPCHRVIGTDGSLTGYAGGLEKKLWLLEHEGIDIGRESHDKSLCKQ